MAQHGGYRKPANPAATSGPGALSRRTDGQPTMELNKAGYGKQSQFKADQQGAPLAKAQPPAGSTPPSGGPPSLTPLNAPSQRPDEPVTSGAAVGPGVGPEALGLPDPDKIRNQDAEQLRKYLPVFIEQAASPNATPSFQAWVRLVRAELQ